jgi:hypothetical protein
MKAKRIFYDRGIYPDGAIVEMIIWAVPDSVPGSTHHFKYRLFYGYQGNRVVCYDNERGKGDHLHFHGEQKNYTFTTVERLVRDFLNDISEVRGDL